MKSTDYRGSRKHILDWVETPAFPAELTHLLEPTGAVVTDRDTWQPRGHAAAIEARLETFAAGALQDASKREMLRDWWLAHPRRANTPNWDIAATCSLRGRPGLVLVEAKANVPELKSEGKPQRKDASAKSQENHARIAKALAEARQGLSEIVPGVDISIGSHYQLANRLAFMWKLATMGVPTILVYLGFLGDDGIRDAGAPFDSPDDWDVALRDHARKVVPEFIFERRLDCGGTPMWFLVRSRQVIEPSKPRQRKADD